MRPGPAAGRALARGPSGDLLHQRAAPPRRLRGLPPGAAADRAARPGRGPVRGLRRAAARPSVRAVRRRGQNVRERLCARCSLRGRPRACWPGSRSVPGLTVVTEAIAAARNPYSALNWLRTGAPAVILAEVAAGRTAVTTRRWTSTRTGGPRTTSGICWSPAGRCRPGRGPGPRRTVEPRGARRHRRACRPAAGPGLPDLAGPAAPAPPVRTSPGPHTVTNGARHRVIAVVAFLAWLPGMTSPWPPAAKATWRPGWPPARPPTTSGTSWPRQATASTARPWKSPARNEKPAPRPVPNSGGNHPPPAR